MSYDMYWVETEHSDDSYFCTNISGMQLIRGAMKAAGVLDVDYQDPIWPKLQQGEKETKDDYQARLEQAYQPVRSFRSENDKLVPIGKFCSNDGWHVLPEECLLIADALDKLLSSEEEIFYRDTWAQRTISLSPDDKEWVKQFADYCRKAADKKGFTVW